MLYLKDAKSRIDVKRVNSPEFVQLAYNYAALDVRRLQSSMPSCFLLAHAIIESEMTILLEWCTWPTLLQYAGAHATLGRSISPPIIQLVTWELLRGIHYLNQVLGGPHCNITMETVLIHTLDVKKPQIKITFLEQAGQSGEWQRGALKYRPPEKLFGSQETYELEPQDDMHDLFSIGICLATLSLTGHPLDEDMSLLVCGDRYNPQCTKYGGSTILDILRDDHESIRPPAGELRTLEFEHFVRLAVFMQALGNGIVPGGSDDPALCFAVWPEFSQLPEVMGFLSIVRAQCYGGSREARIICDTLYRDSNRMGVIRALMQWLPRKRRRDLDAALRRWGFRNNMSNLPIVQYDNTRSDITRFSSTSSFYAEFAESGACALCGHMARFRCKQCLSIGSGRLYCSKECSELDGEHRSTCLGI